MDDMEYTVQFEELSCDQREETRLCLEETLLHDPLEDDFANFLALAAKH